MEKSAHMLQLSVSPADTGQQYGEIRSHVVDNPKSSSLSTPMTSIVVHYAVPEGQRYFPVVLNDTITMVHLGEHDGKHVYEPTNMLLKSPEDGLRYHKSMSAEDMYDGPLDLAPFGRPVVGSLSSDELWMINQSPTILRGLQQEYFKMAKACRLRTSTALRRRNPLFLAVTLPLRTSISAFSPSSETRLRAEPLRRARFPALPPTTLAPATTLSRYQTQHSPLLSIAAFRRQSRTWLSTLADTFWSAIRPGTTPHQADAQRR